ncbi:hypothetical protein SNK05_008070 [Fusarium graminearum]
MDTQTTSGSRWVECLFDIDGSIIPGSTLRPIGPGLHVRAKLEMGLYVKPAMKLQLSVQHQSQTHLFAIAIIPLQMILGKPHIADVQTADQVSLHLLLAHQQMGRFEPPRVSDSFMSTIPEEEQHHALDIASITKTVRTLRVDVSRGDVIISSRRYSIRNATPTHKLYKRLQTPFWNAWNFHFRPHFGFGSSQSPSSPIIGGRL